MNYSVLDKKVILSWRIGRIIFLAITISFFLLVNFILILTGVPAGIFPYVYILEGLIFLYRLLAIVVYPIIEYRQWKYLITDDKVEIRHGLFFITTSVIPVVRIQHITSSSGPINRKLGLVKLTIFTASGSFDIEGLTNETADTISNNLKTKLYKRLDDKGLIKVGE